MLWRNLVIVIFEIDVMKKKVDNFLNYIVIFKKKWKLWNKLMVVCKI